MKPLLLDTHALLWWVDDAPQLSPAAREAIGDANRPCFVSLASCWEMAIKCSLGKLRLAVPVGAYVSQHVAENGFRLLPIALEHAARVETLPFHHRDPFDRLLAAQAVCEDLELVSADPAFDAYGVMRRW